MTKYSANFILIFPRTGWRNWLMCVPVSCPPSFCCFPEKQSNHFNNKIGSALSLTFFRLLCNDRQKFDLSKEFGILLRIPLVQ